MSTRRMLSLGSSFLLVFGFVLRPNPAKQMFSSVDKLGKPVSIETGSEGPDHKGFLKCAAAVLGPEFRHDTTDGVFDKLSSKPDQSNIAVIVGHGWTGVQCTGNGDECPGHDTIMMADYNETFWQPSARKIQKDFTSVSLLGCEIGSGTAGAKFLYQMAQTIQRPVRGPDSLVFCDSKKGILFVDGGGWVEAIPGAGEPDVHPPKRYTFKPSTSFQFTVDGTQVPLLPSAITVQRFEHRTINESNFRQLRLDISMLLDVVDFGAPFKTSARPAAILTGRFYLRLAIRNQSIERGFILYNDVLVEDMVERDVFYRVDRDKLSGYISQLTQ